MACVSKKAVALVGVGAVLEDCECVREKDNWLDEGRPEEDVDLELESGRGAVAGGERTPEADIDVGWGLSLVLADV